MPSPPSLTLVFLARQALASPHRGWNAITFTLMSMLISQKTRRLY